MANTFYRKLSRNTGNVATAVGNYTVGSGNTAIVLGLTVCNTTGSAVNTDVEIYDVSTNSTYLVKDAPIPGGGSLVVVGGDQKLVLQAGDAVRVVSSTTSSLDVIMSIMEIS